MEESHLPLAAQQKKANDDDDDDDEEKAHFQQVCRSYQQYATFHQTIWQGVNHRVQRLLTTSRCGENEVSSSDTNDDISTPPTVESILPQQLRSGTIEHQKMSKDFCNATIGNQFFLDSVLRYSGVPTSQEVMREVQQTSRRIDWATEDQMSKVDSVLKSVARDWSVEGIKERSVAYDRMLMALDKFLPLDSNRVPPRVAVPGSGLGRLAWEIHSKGYTVEGSDFSLPMLLASDFILNGCAIPDNMQAVTPSGYRQFNISPWIAETKNVISIEYRIKAVTVPDVDPSAIRNEVGNGEEAPQFSMMAGEFLSLYSQFLPENQKHNCTMHDRTTKKGEKFNAITCSYFLDTAPSLPDYLITIYHMLADGGLLLHFGPLMYHWSGHGSLLPIDLESNGGNRIGDTNNRYQSRNAYLDPRYLSSVDFTWDEAKAMIENTGFEILIEELNIPALYASNPNSMMKVSYDCVFLVARKKRL